MPLQPLGHRSSGRQSSGGGRKKQPDLPESMTGQGGRDVPFR
ncbi:hypothetical protein ACFOPQ_19060 [Deinococcus antarcticus]|uniref:Uncharacterized protein n=1 Tax=Deinococcus antarcticus TaxID=1298767 RepID=A0ABV8AAW8_9DEIO